MCVSGVRVDVVTPNVRSGETQPLATAWSSPLPLPLCTKTPWDFGSILTFWACEKRAISPASESPQDSSMPFCTYSSRDAGEHWSNRSKTHPLLPRVVLCIAYKGGKAADGRAWGKLQGFFTIRTLNRDNPVIWPPFRPRNAHKVILLQRLWGKCEGRGVSSGSVQRGRHVDRNCEYQLPVVPVAHRSIVSVCNNFVAGAHTLGNFNSCDSSDGFCQSGGCQRRICK
jgi:hypothetical protein